jgi:uncharacterized membrane protein YkoI
MRTNTVRGLLLAAAVVGLADVAFAEDDPKLIAEAKVKEADARAIALARVKGGRVKSEELEREHNHLIWSYDIEVPGKAGIEEVNVDAMSGKVLAVLHEGRKLEQREALAERKEQAAKAAQHH